MKIARTILLLSPILLWVPPLIDLQSTVTGQLFGSFFGLILNRFPWNLLMGGICYSYASQLGREAFWWGGFSFFFPFLTPLILAFVSPKYNSPADLKNRRELAYKAATAGAEGRLGPFPERFPLLAKCLDGKPETTSLQVRTRFEPVPANYEFWVTVKTDAVPRINTEADTRKLTLWTEDLANGTELYGAGLVQAVDLEATLQWLKGACASGEKLTVAWRELTGEMKFLEFYAA